MSGYTTTRTTARPQYHQQQTASQTADVRREMGRVRDTVRGLRTRLESQQSSLTSMGRNVAAAASCAHRAQRDAQRVRREVDRFRKFSEREFAAIRAREAELAAEIGRAERRATDHADRLHDISMREINALEQELVAFEANVQAEFEAMNRYVDARFTHVEETQQALRDDFERDRRDRLSREGDRLAQARLTLGLVEERLRALGDLDSLDLSGAVTTVRQNNARAREMIDAGQPAAALAAAQACLSSVETATLEAQRRRGVIDGNVQHLRQVAERIDRDLATPHFHDVYRAEAPTLERIRDYVLETAERWESRQPWIAFQAERERLLEATDAVQAGGAQMAALVPSLQEVLDEREQRVQHVAKALVAQLGRPDDARLSYPNEDPKGPRQLRMAYGGAVLELNFELDGTLRQQSFGWSTRGECQSAQQTVVRALDSVAQVVESAVDPTNPQQALVAPEAGARDWQHVTRELDRAAHTLTR